MSKLNAGKVSLLGRGFRVYLNFLSYANGFVFLNLRTRLALMRVFVECMKLDGCEEPMMRTNR